MVFFSSAKRKAKSGSALAEYTLMGSLIVLAAIAALMALGLSVRNVFHDMINSDPKVMAQQQAKMLQVAGTATQKAGNVSTGMTSAANAASAKAGTGASLQVTQTVGANGGEQVSNNAAMLFALAKKYEQTNPTVSNALITLGQKGQAMAQAIQAGDKANMSNLEAQFGVYYVQNVDNVNDPSNVLSQLSADDQQLVKTLTNQSEQLTESASGTSIFDGGNAGSTGGSSASVPVSTTNAATQVNSNSLQTIQCGQNMKCN